MKNKYLLMLGIWLGGLSIATAQNYPSFERFGKNRIQYRSFEWKTVRTANFEIYYYEGGTQIANLTAQYAESEFDRVTELLGYTPYSRIKIFLFNSPQELAQSNIGLNAQGGLSGRDLDLSKSRVELAFTGDQISFRRQIVRDISMLFVYDMLYGGSLKDALQSSLLLTLPDWFMPGIAAYIAEGNSIELDDYVRDVALTRPVKKPGLLAGAEAERVGHSIWNYIVQKYGRDNVSNILNLTRIIRNEQSSIASTLGIPYSRFLREWREYYAGMANAVAQSYQAGADDFQVKLGSVDDKSSLISLKLSPDKQFFAYTVLRDGKFSVEVVNTTNRKKTTVLAGGYRLDGQATRTGTPLVAWQRDNNLIVMTDELGKTNLYRFGNFGKRPKQEFRRTVNGLSQVVWMDASDDGGSLILSADRQGQNDLFLYSINRGSYQQITNDLYDDLYPQFVGRTARTVVFSSNRQADTLGVDKGTYRSIRNQLSLFSHEGTARDLSVVRLTDSLSNATQPTTAGESTIYFLNDIGGVTNLYRLATDTKAISQVTAFPQNIRLYDLNPANGGFVYSSLKNGNAYIGFRSQLNLTQSVQPPLTQRSRSLVRPAAANANGSGPAITEATVTVSDSASADSTRRASRRAGTPTTGTKLALGPGEVDTDNYQFDPEVLRAAESRQRRSTTTAPSLATTLPRSRRRENITIRGPFDYKGTFTINNATSGWRVDPISAKNFGYYQDVTLTDLLENHVLRAGGFITTSLKNTDLFAEYTNQKYRVDYGLRVDRQALFVEASDAGLLQKYRYNRFAATASYPISVNTRLTVSPFYAITRLVDLASYGESDRVSDYAGVRGEFVFDNTKINGMNMVMGTKMKVKFEEYTGLRASAQGFRRLTLDLRHYQKISRSIVWANRASYGQFFGARPQLFRLGGMDDWLNADYQGSRFLTNYTDPDQVFNQEFVTNLRGFDYSARTGPRYLLFNSELRIPIVQYFAHRPIYSGFFRNLQLTGFADAGTAYSGSNPFGLDNSSNTKPVILAGNYFSASVINFRNPFLVGYGVGARTTLLGFYGKVDVAWGQKDYVTSGPKFYFTLGYDF